MLIKAFGAMDEFTGHVGGDDFIVLLSSASEMLLGVLERIRVLCGEFCDFAAYFFTDDDRLRGRYRSTGRDGTLMEFPLLRVSAAIIEVPSGIQPDNEEMSRAAMLLKKKAKDSPTGESVMRFGSECAQAVDYPFGRC